MNQAKNSCKCGCASAAKKVMEAVKRPTLRQSLHYDCGIYKDENDLNPALSFHLGGDHATPLIRIVAVVAAVVLALAMVCKCKKQSCDKT